MKTLLPLLAVFAIGCSGATVADRAEEGQTTERIAVEAPVVCDESFTDEVFDASGFTHDETHTVTNDNDKVFFSVERSTVVARQVNLVFRIQPGFPDGAIDKYNIASQVGCANLDPADCNNHWGDPQWLTTTLQVPGELVESGTIHGDYREDLTAYVHAFFPPRILSTGSVHVALTWTPTSTSFDLTLRKAGAEACGPGTSSFCWTFNATCHGQLSTH